MMSGVKYIHSIALNNLLKLHEYASLNQVEPLPSKMFRKIHFKMWWVWWWRNMNSSHLGDITTLWRLAENLPWDLILRPNFSVLQRDFPLSETSMEEESWGKLKDYSRKRKAGRNSKSIPGRRGLGKTKRLFQVLKGQHVQRPCGRLILRVMKRSKTKMCRQHT